MSLASASMVETQGDGSEREARHSHYGGYYGGGYPGFYGGSYGGYPGYGQAGYGQAGYGGG
jgi:hypothetical protein